MIRSIILLLVSPLGLCTHFTPIQTIHNYAAVEGIAIAPNTTYVAASDYDGTLRIYFQQDNQLSLHQTIIDNFNYIWEVSVSDDDWLAVCWSHNPAIYVLNSSNNQF
jgi:WD40 repeat protein